MISLNLPTDGWNRYASILNVWYGPFSEGSTPLYDEIPLELSFDSLHQGPDVFGEKVVDHSKAIGDVTFYPYALLSKSSATAARPDAETIEVVYASTPGIKTNIYLPYGDLWSSKRSSYEIASNGVHIHTAVRKTDYGFEKISIACNYATDATTVNSVSAVQVKDIHVVNGKLAYQYRSVSKKLTGPYGLYQPTSWNWFGRVNWENMFTLFDSLVDKSVGSYSSSSASTYIMKTTTVVSPSKMKLDIAAYVYKEMINATQPSLVDYGDIAMKATENLNANQVNMIAFVRDIMRPWELIPKLKNLRSLKTLSENFLILDYGILPTISDLQEIFEALRKHAPYVDRNGFKCGYASHFDESSNETVTFELEQRIKVAVDNTDLGLLSIVNRIDTMGFLPTCKNLWDLIPFSFVIDWFLDIGEFLERIDFQYRLMRYRVRYATLSYKTTATAWLIATPDLPYLGQISLVQYHRWTTDHCPEPSKSSIDSPDDFNHWLEASALIVQSRK